MSWVLWLTITHKTVRYYGGAKHPNICSHPDHQTSAEGAKHRNMIAAGKSYYGASHLAWNEGIQATNIPVLRTFYHSADLLRL